MFEKNSFLCLIVLKATKRPFPTLKRIFTAQKAIAYIQHNVLKITKNVSFHFFKDLNSAPKFKLNFENVNKELIFVKI